MNSSSIYEYPAIFTPENKGMYSIRFPDFENCNTCGDNLEDGLIMAEDALALIISTEYEKQEKPVPVATPIDRIKLSKDEFVESIKCDTTRYRKSS